MTALILDGSNLCLQGQQKKRNIKTLGALLPCLRALLLRKIEAYVIFDASFRYRIDPKSTAATEYKALLDRDAKFQMAPAGMEADAFILEFAAVRDFGVLSDDMFKKYLTIKGQERAPHFGDKKIQLHKFQMMMGALVIPSLKIRYLIDESALDVDDIIAERNGSSGRAPAPAKAPAAKAAAPAKAPAAKAPAAKAAAMSEPRDESAGGNDAPTRGKEMDAAPANPELDFLLELSPLCLRAGDVFETYRILTGKSWKAGNSTKNTAEEFARERFSGDIIYVQPAERKPNDGYFFDPRYGEDNHAAVRSYLMEHCPKMLPLIASARNPVTRLLELIHDPELASGFELQQLYDRADALGIPHYRRYLRCLVYALIAADGVLGSDAEETDIETILNGEMHVVPDENRSDRRNYLQRGILYLLAGPDNALPEAIHANMSWMLQLPRDEKVRRMIINGHLEWLAQDEV